MEDGAKEPTNIATMQTAVLLLFLVPKPNLFCLLVCAINIAAYVQLLSTKKIPIPDHNCYKNWSGSSCSMEANIIVEGFRLSESMHGLKYQHMIGDSSVQHAVHNGVPSYGRHVQKLECTNHAVKCFREHLESWQKITHNLKVRMDLLLTKCNNSLEE